MKNFILVTIALSCIQYLYSADISNSKPDEYLLSYKLVKQHTKKSIEEVWKKNRIPKIVIPINNDVDIYEITYKAPWIDSSWIIASGICYVPKVSKGVPVMMYGHGTQIEKERTINDNDAQQGLCLGFATDGYFALYPDYYGIGLGNSIHLYQHAWSEAMAFIYMLYAADELAKKINLQTNGQLFLTGYSQGGHASFAAQKYFEQINHPKYKLTASSPMSGAYDMTGSQEQYMFQEYPRPFYLPYLLISYQKAYNVLDIDNVYAIFKQPFDTLLPAYFENNKNKSLYDLDKIMPKIPKDIVTENLIEEYVKNPEFEFKKKLKENNLIDWKPKTPTQLCYCKGDREVHYRNTEVAYETMKANGVNNIKINNLSNYLDHNSCAAFAVLATKYYFDRFKKNGENKKMKDVPGFKKFLMNFVKKDMEKKYLKDGSDFHYDKR